MVQLDAGLSQCEALGEIDWCVSDDTVVRPDIIITCGVLGERLSKAPALIVEIIPPSAARRDELLKFELYQREGVEWYILVYPDENKAKVYRLSEGRYVKEADFGTEAFEFDIGLCSVLFISVPIERRDTKMKCTITHVKVAPFNYLHFLNLTRHNNKKRHYKHRKKTQIF